MLINIIVAFLLVFVCCKVLGVIDKSSEFVRRCFAMTISFNASSFFIVSILILSMSLSIALRRNTLEADTIYIA